MRSKALTVKKTDSPPMRGEPEIDRERADWLNYRRCCQYGLAMLQQRGKLPQNVSHLVAVWRPDIRTVRFMTRKTMKLRAEYRIPDYVMDFVG